MDTKDYITLRARKSTQQNLKIVAALSRESMLDTLDRLVAQELERLQKGSGLELSAKVKPASEISNQDESE